MKLDMNKDALAILNRLGMNQYESRLYAALLTVSSASASRVAELAGIPRPRAYDVLTNLEKMGFVQIQPGRPTKFKSVNVEEAFGNIKRRKEDEFQKEIGEMERLAKELKNKVKSELPPESVKASDYVWVLKERKNIYSKLESLLNDAKEDIVISTTNKGLERKLELYSDILKKAKSRGTKIKFIVPSHDSNTKRASQIGEVAIRKHGSRAVIADDHSLLFLTPEEEKTDVATWIKSPHFSDNLRRTLS
jgi:sugar-specific transcriptional regulator TrmB